MQEIIVTPLLKRLIDDSKNIGKLKNPPFTVERFMVAAINLFGGDYDENDLEFCTLKEVLSDTVTDFEEAKKALTYYIDNNAVLFSDEMYMDKMLTEATEVMQKAGLPALDTIALYLCILKAPSEPLVPFLSFELFTEEEMDFIENPFPEEDKNPSENCGNPPSREAEDTADTADNTQVTKQDVAVLVKDIKRIREALQSEILGQDNAVNTFVSGYFQACMRSMVDTNHKRPRATFLFAGPPGVGKTFLAEKAAEVLGLPFQRFDMSEYCDKESSLEFCGSDGVYKNSGQGNFTSFVSENPKSVVLLDEIEKAHISIIHLFLQILDAGRIRDNKTDKEISLKDVILIFTTNAGKQLYKGSEDKDLSAISGKVIIDALEKDVDPTTGVPYFPSAICSRFASGNVVMFNHIDVHDLRAIAKKEIQRQAQNFKSALDISIKVDDLVYTAMLLSEGTRADARTTKSRAEAFFNDELYELLRLVSSEKAKTNVEDIESVSVEVDLASAPKDIANLFVASDKKCALVLACNETVSLCAEKNKNCSFIGVQSSNDAIEAIKTNDVNLIILDVNFGMPSESLDNLNAEDVKTPARELWQLLREQKSVTPVYIIEACEGALDEEEKISFSRQGVRGFLKLAQDDEGLFAKKLDEILAIIHQQASMVKLAKENKLVSFETRQAVSENGKTATITLFDFKTEMAVDAEDAKNILGAMSMPNVRFKDVIGAQEAKDELDYFVNYLKNPKKYMGTGVKTPKGVLLYGPPGTGKTMLAKAMACEAGVTFIATEGNAFLKKYVGEGEDKVRELFRTARKYAPAVLFIDEIEAIAKERKGGTNAAANGEDVLTTFLTEMDGFVNNSSRPVFVLAATNFDVEEGSDKSLDPALMRRFDRRIYIDLPNKENRITFLQNKNAANKALQLSNDIIDSIAVRSTGMSLAQLDSVVELALRSAIRRGSTVVTDDIFEEAFETFNGGEVKKWDESQLLRVARHEAGHALLCWHGGGAPSYLTIVARGDHGGYMQPTVQEGKAVFTLDELLARVRTALGGRAAEIVYYGNRDGISTGAGGDLASATGIARKIVCTYGMDEIFGLAVVGGSSGLGLTAVNRILKEQMAEAIKIVSENKPKVDALVEALMTKNHLNGAEIGKALAES